MNIDLKQLATRESEQVEWKRNVADISDLLRTVTAFSNDFQNMGGGYIVCGAEETQDEHGFQKVVYTGLTSERLKEIEGRIMSDSRGKIEPPVTPIVQELETGQPDRRVLVFIIPSTGYAHSYRASGKDSSTYYVRLSRETVEAKNGILRELLVRRGALEPWDRRLNDSAALEDIDLLSFREISQQLGSWNPSVDIETYFSEQMRIAEFVPSLGASRPLDATIRPRNFSLLLFGKTPTKFFQGAWTKVSLYPGKDRSQQTAERHELTGSVVTQAKKALDILKTHSSTAFDKESDEPNAPKYPERALQEAVINAIVHRDYELSDPCSITIFSDRIEIRSPGSLPRGINKEKFIEGAASPSWRNQSLAFFFNRLQLAQAEGQGIPTIIRTMAQLGSPAPVFELDEAAVTCTLPAHPRHEMMRHVAEIERLLLQQDNQEAENKLKPLLEKHPSNPKLLELLVQLSALRQRPEVAAEYAREKRLRPSDLPARTAYQFADLMNQSSQLEHKEMGRDWLDDLSKQRLEADEVKHVAQALRKLGKDEQAVQIISRYINSSTSPLAVSATLYDTRARAKMDLAKKCMETGRNFRIDRERKAKAWALCRRYLDEAESDIIRALETETHPREREYYEKDLEFVRKLRAQSEKPRKTAHDRQPTKKRAGRRRN